MIAINNSKSAFHSRWIDYCKRNKIPFKLVNGYASNLIEQLSDCDMLLWHHSQNNPKDLIVAKPILFALEHSGIKVFPDFRTNWHFDDKLGQKYLMEALGIPTPLSWVFFDKSQAMEWMNNAKFPIVFKLRRGAGSANVKLVKDKHQARLIIDKAFGSGFSNYEGWGSLKEIYRKWNLRKTDFKDVLKGTVRLFLKPDFTKVVGREVGYVYFQEFIPDNDHDIRVIVIGDKAFAIKRLVRKNDFRASGSGHVLYEKYHFKDEWIELAFRINDNIKSQSLALDFIFRDGNPLVVEMSYGFVPEVYDKCTGYWDKKLNWHEGPFDPYGWMIENLMKK